MQHERRQHPNAPMNPAGRLKMVKLMIVEKRSIEATADRVQVDVTEVDDHTHLALSKILEDEQAVTAFGFWTRAEAWFAAQGIQCERVITDNGACSKSMQWTTACTATGTP